MIGKPSLLFLLSLSLMACTPPEPDLKRIEAGKVRQQLFEVCMEIASKNKRQGDDDVSDMIDSCSDHAHYTARMQVDL